MKAAGLWAQGVACRGTPAETFLRTHRADIAPSETVRFLPGVGFREGFVACPAAVFALRKWPDAEVVGLEAWPLAFDGRCAIRVGAELWIDPGIDLATLAVQVGKPEVNLSVMRCGLDALTAAMTTGSTVWGVRDADNLDRLPVPDSVQQITLVSTRTPRPELVGKVRAAGRELRWVDENEVWNFVYGFDGEAA